MIRLAIIAGALLALGTPAQACHRFTVWRYHFAQRCLPHAAAAPLAAQHERMVMPLATRINASRPRIFDASPARKTIAEPGDGPPAWAIERLRTALRAQIEMEITP
jgi:hypothetical protein